MENKQFDNISHFLRLQKRMSEFYDGQIAAAAARAGLTKPEADVLLFLSNNPQFNTARDVVAYRGLSKTYVSKAVDQLTGRGLVEQAVSAADRRVQYLRLTPEAARPVRVLRRAQLAYFHLLGDGVTPEERSMLDRLLRRVQGNLDRAR